MPEHLCKRTLARIAAALSLFAASALAQGRPPEHLLVRPNMLARDGSFKLPTGASAGSLTRRGYEYGATAIGFNPSKQSLFVVGHDWDQFIGEVGVPRFGQMAPVLQPLTDAAEGRKVGPGTTKVGGILVHEGQLFFTKYIYYDATASQVEALFQRPPELSVKGQVQGPSRVGPFQAGFYSGYMAQVPPPLRQLLGGPALIGNCCIGIISRSSFGPAAFAIDPKTIAQDQKPVPLVYYPATHTTLGKWDEATEYFGGADSMGGVVVPGGFGSVLFFGRHGSTFCYGGANCKDPTSASQGVHGYPYKSYVWAYSAEELAQVRAGAREGWDVKPYQVWDLPELGGAPIGGAAYDPASGRIFLSQPSGTQPLVHVYRIKPPE